MTNQYKQHRHSAQERALISLAPGRYPNVYMVRVISPFQPPFVGDLKTDGDGTLIIRENSSLVASYGFWAVPISAALLHAREIPFRWIVCDIVGRGKLVTSRKFILAHGETVRPRYADPQIVLRVDMWGIGAARSWEAEQRLKGGLEHERATCSSFSGDAA